MLKTLWHIIKNTSLLDMKEIIKYYSDGKADIVFYSSHPIDEEWIISTIKACEKSGIKYAVIRNRFYKDSYKDIAAPCYYTGKNGALFFYAKAFLSASSGLYRRVMPLFSKHRIHMPHSLVSLHMIFPEDAFTHFNTLFCVGKHHIKEFQALQKNKDYATYKIGYGKMDTLVQEYKNSSFSPENKQHILIAPSWAKDNIIDSIGEQLISELLACGYEVTLRPHPLFVLDKNPTLKRIEKHFSADQHFTLEDPMLGNDAIFKADLIISDYSGVAFEYIFLREKPALFIDVAKKVLNPNYEKLGITPMELSLRSELGLTCQKEITSILESINSLLHNSEHYAKKIVELRKEYLYNHLECGTIAAQTIKTILKG